MRFYDNYDGLFSFKLVFDYLNWSFSWIISYDNYDGLFFSSIISCDLYTVFSFFGDFSRSIYIFSASNQSNYGFYLNYKIIHSITFLLLVKTSFFNWIVDISIFLFSFNSYDVLLKYLSKIVIIEFEQSYFSIYLEKYSH